MSARTSSSAGSGRSRCARAVERVVLPGCARRHRLNHFEPAASTAQPGMALAVSFPRRARRSSRRTRGGTGRPGQEERTALPAGGQIDERGQPPLPRIVFLRAHHPPRHHALIARRLRREKRPRAPSGGERLHGRHVEHGRRPRLHVAVRSRFIPALEGARARRRHHTLTAQLVRPGNVHRAPETVRPARREALDKAGGVEFLPDAVDPAKRERLFQSFGVGDAGSPRAFSVEADPEFARRGVMRVEPGAKACRRGEKCRLDGAGAGFAFAQGLK